MDRVGSHRPAAPPRRGPVASLPGPSGVNRPKGVDEKIKHEEAHPCLHTKDAPETCARGVGSWRGAGAWGLRVVNPYP